MNLKPYPEYKDSGVAWLGMCRNIGSCGKPKYLFKEAFRKVFPMSHCLQQPRLKVLSQKLTMKTEP